MKIEEDIDFRGHYSRDVYVVTRVDDAYKIYYRYPSGNNEDTIFDFKTVSDLDVWLNGRAIVLNLPEDDPWFVESSHALHYWMNRAKRAEKTKRYWRNRVRYQRRNLKRLQNTVDTLEAVKTVK